MLTMVRCGTRDLERARPFYSEIAKLLDAKLVIDRPGAFAYRGREGFMFMVATPRAGEATVGNGTQFGLVVQDRAVVDAVYAKALELGGTDEGAPGLRGPDPEGAYVAYFRDPDGNKLSIFYMGNVTIG